MKFLRNSAQFFIFTIAYFLLGVLSSYSLFEEQYLFIWLPFGLGIAGVYYRGRSILYSVFAAQFIFMQFRHFPLWEEDKFIFLFDLFISLSAVITVWLGSRCLRVRVLNDSERLFRFGAILKFFLFVVAVPSLFFGIVFTTINSVFFYSEQFNLQFLSLSLAGGIGIITLVPLVLTFRKKIQNLFENSKVFFEFIVFFLLLTVNIILVFELVFDNSLKNILVAYFIMPLYIWMALRFNSRIVSAVLFLSYCMITVFAFTSNNYYLLQMVEVPLIMLQSFFMIIGMITFFIHSVILERSSYIFSLRQSEKDLLETIENVPVPVVITNQNNKIELTNSEFTKLTGYRHHEIEDLKDWFIKAYPDKDYRELARKAWYEDLDLQERNYIEKDFIISDSDGNKKDIMFRISSLGNRKLVALIDLTKRKSLTRRVQESEQMLSNLIRNIQGMVFKSGLDENWKMSFVSEGGFLLTGYLPSAFLESGNVNFNDIIVEKYREYVRTSVESAVKRGGPYEIQYQIKTKTGEIKWVSERGVGNYDESGVCTGLEGLIVDITERIKIMDSLRISESRYRSLFENLPLSLWEEDYSGAVTFLNELEDSGIDNVRSYLVGNPEVMRDFIKRIEILHLNKHSLRLFHIRNINYAKKHPEEVFLQENQIFYLDILLKMRDGEKFIENVPAEILVKGEKKILNTSWYVMPGHEKDLSRVLVSIIDITDLKDAEKEVIELNKRLEEKVKLRTEELNRTNRELEAFSYSVSHDLKAPLRAIQGFSDLLSKNHSANLDDKGLHYLKNVRESAENMTRLINDLLEFSRLGRRSLTLKAVDSKRLARSVWHDLTLFEDRKEIIFEATDLPVVTADASLLSVVFNNLLSNAIKFTRDTKVPEIKISAEKENGSIKFLVKDNGTGFDPKYEDKIFKVFQRLHVSGKYDGSGIGLALVKRIVHRHGGKVGAIGKPGEGAVFYFTIPVETESE